MVPSILQLFGMFWSYETLRRICAETNRYATKELEITYMGDGGLQIMTYSRGGEKLYVVTVQELKAFIACTMYMGLKNFPMYDTIRCVQSHFYFALL